MSQSATTDLLSASLPLDMTREDPIPSTVRAIHKFFEPIILFAALIDAVKDTAKPPKPEPNINIEDPRQLFCSFVNKLSHVCDKERGGDTVTSFVVLRGPGDSAKPQFVFAVNRQSNSQLLETVLYVKTLFRIVTQAPVGEKNQHEARSSLLYHILRFNRPRISFYLSKLESQAIKCREQCKSKIIEEGPLIEEQLDNIVTSLSRFGDSEDEYMRKCQTMIQLLVRIEKSKAGEAIKSTALEDRIPGYTSMECWSELFHTMNRILAYPQSAQFFLRAKEMYPSLFRNPAVNFLSSSRPVEKPGRRKSQTADKIVGRMTRKPEEIQQFRKFAASLQAYNLDDRIQAEFQKSTLRPIAHSEVVLLNWLLKPGEVAPEKFFNDYMYIGSSKPICKLCDHYFRDHRSNVKHRSSHGNFYPSWRIPDVFPYQGEEAIEMKQVMTDRILLRVRKDAFDIVERKATPSMKLADTNTLSSRMTLVEKWSVRGPEAGGGGGGGGSDIDEDDDEDDDDDDIASMMGGVSLNS